MEKVGDLKIGEKVLIETGYTNLDKSDNEFFCKIAGYDEFNRVILDAENAVCFDGRNTTRPFFVVESNAAIEMLPTYQIIIQGCYVLFDIIGMDTYGRFILKTIHKVEDNS